MNGSNRTRKVAMDLASPRLMVILAKSCSVLWWGQKISESKWGSRAIRIVLNLLELIDLSIYVSRDKSSVFAKGVITGRRI